MRISDVTVDQVASGKRWRLHDPEQLDDGRPLEDLEIESAPVFGEDDYVVYSGVSVSDSGRVRPLLLIRCVGDHGYGGDYCELKEDRWRQVGLERDPQAEHSREFIADPLPNDPSFDSDEEDYLRRLYRSEFRKWAQRLRET